MFKKFKLRLWGSNKTSDTVAPPSPAEMPSKADLPAREAPDTLWQPIKRLIRETRAHQNRSDSIF